jgi:hypothetical protein
VEASADRRNESGLERLVRIDSVKLTQVSRFA